MRDHVRAFCAAAVSAFAPAGPVIEFGAFQVDGQRELADLRPLFPGAPYIGCDARPGPGVDRIEDIAATTFGDEAAGTIVCLDTLEHVFPVAEAFTEMHRLLRPGGLLIAATVMRFPIHDYPEDYWRFTPRCLDRLAAAFPFRVIGSQGVATFPHTVFAAALKAPAPADARLRADRLVADHMRWLETRRAALPAATRLRRLLRASYRSKGERREIADEYTSRFEMHDETSTR